MNAPMKKNRGFTLIEILIVMVVIGILAAIALPSYQNQLRKSTRAGAQAVMMDIANKQQFYLQTQRGYATDYTQLGLSPPTDVTNFYAITIDTVDNTATPPTFRVVATPVAGKRQVADGTLTLNNIGVKTPPDKW